VDKPTISPVIPHIGQQIRLSLTFAKSLADLQVFISQTSAGRHSKHCGGDSPKERRSLRLLRCTAHFFANRYQPKRVFLRS